MTAQLVSTGQITILDVNDSISAILSNESITLASDSTGNVSSYSTCYTNIRIFLGTFDDTASWTFTAAPLAGVTGSFGSGASINVYTVSNMTVNSGYVDITAAKQGKPSITKRFTIAKSLQGLNGPLLVLTNNGQAFTFTDGNLNPASGQLLTLTAVLTGLTGTVTFTTSPAITFTTINSTSISISGSQFGTNKQVTVTASISGMTDVTTLVRLEQTTAAAGATVGADASNLNVVIGGDNLISNSNFEIRNVVSAVNRPNGFAAYNNAVAAMTWQSVAGRTGGLAFAIRADAAFTNTFGLVASGAQVDNGITGGVVNGWQPNKTYVVSFKAKKLNAAAWTNVALAWNTAPATSVVVSSPNLTTAWQRYSFRITWGSTTETLGKLFVNGANGNATAINDEFHLDELLIQEGDVVSEWFPSVNDAATSATAANSLIADISSDSKLTGAEKPSIRSDWNAIASEKAAINAQASLFNITTENTTYNAAFQALATYLNAGTTWVSGIPSWISDANLGVTTTIVGVTFRTTFQTYYDARLALLNAISANIGARVISRPNLVYNGSFENGMIGWTGTTFIASNGTWGPSAVQSAISGTGAIQSTMFPVQPGSWYTTTGDSCMLNITSGSVYFDLMFYAADGVTVVLDGPQNGISTSHDFSTTDANRNLHVVNVKAPSIANGDSADAVFAAVRFVWQSIVSTGGAGGTSNAYLACRQIKVERGQIPATPYTVENTVAQLQKNANDAAVAAASANTELTNIASDNVLSKGEKPQVILDYNAIINEQSGIDAQATNYGITTEKTTYDTNIATLTSYLNGIAYSDTSTNATIVGSTFRTKFSDVYSARQAVLNAIAASARARLTTRINLVYNGSFENGFSGWIGNTASLSIVDGVWGRTAVGSNVTGTGVITQDTRFAVQTSEWYTVTGDSLLLNSTSGAVYFDIEWLTSAFAIISDSGEGRILVNHDFSSNDSNRSLHVVNVQAPSNASWGRVRFVWENIVGATSKVGCRQIKVERGILPATPYTIEATISVLQQNANDAVAAAATANSQISDISSDSKLTGDEKPSIRNDWNSIASEKSLLNAQASAFGITTENTTYNTTFQALATYLNAGTAWVSGIPSWISDANLGVTTTIVGTTFRTNFQTYYDAKIALLNAISTKASTTSTWSGTSGTGKPADNATVGAADAATAWGFNPQFSDWPTGQTYPTGWSIWAGTAPVRETSNIRTAPNAVSWTVSGNTGMVKTASWTTSPMPVGTFITGAFDANVLNNMGGTGSPGYLFYCYTNAALTTYTWAYIPVTNKTVTGWQRVPFTIGVAAGQQIYGVTAYQAASYIDSPGGAWANGSQVVFDNLTFDTQNQIDAANAALYLGAGSISVLSAASHDQYTFYTTASPVTNAMSYTLPILTFTKSNGDVVVAGNFAVRIWNTTGATSTVSYSIYMDVINSSGINNMYETCALVGVLPSNPMNGSNTNYIGASLSYIMDRATFPADTYTVKMRVYLNAYDSAGNNASTFKQGIMWGEVKAIESKI